MRQGSAAGIKLQTFRLCGMRLNQWVTRARKTISLTAVCPFSTVRFSQVPLRDNSAANRQSRQYSVGFHFRDNNSCQWEICSFTRVSQNTKLLYCVSWKHCLKVSNTRKHWYEWKCWSLIRLWKATRDSKVNKTNYGPFVSAYCYRDWVYQNSVWLEEKLKFRSWKQGGHCMK